MKLNVLSVLAVVATVVVSSFTTKVNTTFYYVYDQVGTQTLLTSYSEVTAQPTPVAGSGKINWLRVIDKNDGVIDQAEFLTQFEIYDVVNDNANLLSDESADISGQFDIKN